MKDDIIQVTFKNRYSRKFHSNDKIMDRYKDHLESVAEFLRKTRIISEYDNLPSKKSLNSNKNINNNNFNDNFQIDILELKNFINRNSILTRAKKNKFNN